MNKPSTTYALVFLALVSIGLLVYMFFFIGSDSFSG